MCYIVFVLFMKEAICTMCSKIIIHTLMFAEIIICIMIMIDVCENNYSDNECLRKWLFTYYGYDSVDLVSLPNACLWCP